MAKAKFEMLPPAAILTSSVRLFDDVFGDRRVEELLYKLDRFGVLLVEA